MVGRAVNRYFVGIQALMLEYGCWHYQYCWRDSSYSITLSQCYTSKMLATSMMVFPTSRFYGMGAMVLP